MSLKWFHVFFVTTCIALTVLVGVWAMRHEQWLLALLTVAGGAALVVYRGFFLRKARELGLQ